MMTAQNNKKWLIKSENKILGPYNFEQVENLIFKKQISLIDEIRDPDTRWLYIRENPEFKNVINDVRAQLDSKNDSTMTQHTNLSHSGAKTIDEGGQQTRSQMSPFTDVDMDVQEAALVNEIVDTNINDKQKNDVNEKKQTSRNFIYYNDANAKKSAKSYSKSLIITFSLIILATAGAFGSFYFYTKYSQQKMESDLLVQVKKNQFLGLDQQAVVLFAKLSPIVQKKRLSEVIELFPLLDATGIVQLRDIDELDNSTKLSIESRVSLHMVRFWFYMQTQNLTAAQNQVIKAKTLLPNDNLINENEALMNIRKGKYTAALETFLKLYNDNNLGRYVVGAVQCLQGLSQSEKLKYFPIIEKLVDRHIALHFDYRKELLLVQMAFAKMNDNDILFKLSWKQFINTPAQLATLFRKPSLLAPFSYLWKDLSTYKVIVQKGLGSSEDAIFKIHDYLESAQIGAAVDYAEKNNSSIADAGARQQISLLIYFALGKRNEILALEQAQKLEGNSELNHLLLALTDVALDPSANIQRHLDFFKDNNLKFYQQWVELQTLINAKANIGLRAYLRQNFSNDTDFVVANEARGLLD